MITLEPRSWQPRSFDWCEMLSCIWVVLLDGTVSPCLRCGAPYPWTMAGVERIVEIEDEEPFT